MAETLSAPMGAAPSGADTVKTIAEDGSHTFAAADFGFSDVDGNGFAGVVITSLATAGTIRLNGAAVSAGQFVTAADVAVGKLVFQPAPNGNGSPYGSFTFQVRDDSGTSGQNTDPSANSFTFNVTADNDAPLITMPVWIDAVPEDGVVALQHLDSTSIRIADVDAGSGNITVTLSIAAGTLTLTPIEPQNGEPVDVALTGNGTGTVTVTGTLANVNAVLDYGVVYRPAPNDHGVRTLNVTASDNGNTGSGGARTDSESFPITIRSVNDAPLGADAAKTITQGGSYSFAAADFGFNDVDGNAFAGVVVTSLATSGSILLNGVAVSAGQFVNAADIAASRLTFQPAANGSGTPYSSFTFQVRDDGGVANGGRDTDPSANSFTFNVTAVNQAPVTTVPAAQSGKEDTNLVFSSANGNAITVSDPDAGNGLTVTLSVLNGKLTLATTSGLVSVSGNGTASVTVTGSPTAINTALNGLTYRGNLNYKGSDTLTVQSTDSGSTGTGGTTVAIALAADNAINGDSGDNALNGSPAGDTFMLQDGGNDTANGLGGDDGFYFGGALTAADNVNGGEGTNDQVGIQGNYGSPSTPHQLGAGNLVGVEVLVLLSGADARFGQTGTNSYDYYLSAVDANVSAGGRLTISFNDLKVGEDVTFNGSLEQDGSFLTYGGLGADILTGGQKSDGFYFGNGGLFGANDRVDGQGGSDQLGLQGNYSGANAVVFGANQLAGIEAIILLSGSDARFGGSGAGFNYDLTMHDGNVAAGTTLTVSANLQLNESLTFNASAENDATGRYVVYAGEGADTLIGGAGADDLWGLGGADSIRGGLGADTIRGGAGNDKFIYANTNESTASARDTIFDFTSGDLIDLSLIDANTTVADNQAFSFIGSAAFGGTGAASAGQLRAVQSGANWLIEGDTDGNGVADFVVLVGTTDPSHQIGAGDFML